MLYMKTHWYSFCHYIDATKFWVWVVPPCSFRMFPKFSNVWITQKFVLWLHFISIFIPNLFLGRNACKRIQCLQCRSYDLSGQCDTLTRNLSMLYKREKVIVFVAHSMGKKIWKDGQYHNLPLLCFQLLSRWWKPQISHMKLYNKVYFLECVMNVL